jgi:polyphenol oxidase
MDLIIPSWPAPTNIAAAITTRNGGCSTSPWNSLNLAFHVGDSPKSVEQNWQSVSEQLNLPSKLQLLNQVHGIEIVEVGDHKGIANEITPIADGCYTKSADYVCAVMTADCLPILFCNPAGTEVAAVHAGWRGLAAGVVSSAVKQFCSPATDLMAYLGPAISQQNFEVGPEVRQAFLSSSSHKHVQYKINTCFTQSDSEGEVSKNGRWMADLYGLARVALYQAGVSQIYGGDFCSYADAERFYSYRRDGQTGRMASLIWIS